MTELFNVIPHAIVVTYVILKIFARCYTRNNSMKLMNRSASSQGQKLPFRKWQRRSKLVGVFLAQVITYGIALLILWLGGFFDQLTH